MQCAHDVIAHVVLHGMTWVMSSLCVNKLGPMFVRVAHDDVAQPNIIA